MSENVARRIKLAASVGGVLVLTLLLAIGFSRSLWTRFSRPKSQRDRSAYNPPRSKIATPVPSISLQINSEDELTVFSGTPLIFTARVRNPLAQNVALQNAALKHDAIEIQAALASGEISHDRANRLLSMLGKPEEVPVLHVGDGTLGWDQFVHFNLRSPDGKQRSLPWRLEMVGAPSGKGLTLDAEIAGQSEYLLGPSPASELAPGEYDIVAVLDVPVDASLPQNCWRGLVRSDPVKLTVANKPDRLNQSDQEEWNLQFARYFREAGDSTQALQWAQKALAEKKSSIPARVIAGEVKEAQGDLKGALEAYQAALVEIDKQYPNSYEGPQYLILKISELFAKLRSQSPQEKQTRTP